MKIVFDTHTYIYAKDLTEFKSIYNLVYIHLRFINPVFEGGRQNEQQFFELFEINYKDFIFKLPKNIKGLITACVNFGIKIESFENKRINKKEEHIGFKANFEPRDEQQKTSIESFFQVPDKHATLGALCG